METWIRIKRKEQLEAVRASQVRCDHLILDAAFVLAEREFNSLPAGTKTYLQLPDVLRQNKKEAVKALLDKAGACEGLVIKNLDELGLLLEMQAQERFAIIGDASLYAYNRDAIRFYRALVPEMKFICSEELTDREASELMNDKEAFIYKVYGYQTVMITAQCFRKNNGACVLAKQNSVPEQNVRRKRMDLRDETGNILYAENDCNLCHTVIYNGVPTSMLDKDMSEYTNILYDFTIEEAETVKRILETKQCSSYTRGHHLSPVD